MKKLFVIILSLMMCICMIACGNEKVSDEFEINSEQLEKDGYERIADIAYVKVEWDEEKPVCYIEYCAKIPETSFYFMALLQRDLNCDFAFTWNGEQYTLNDETPEDTEKAFPDDWQEVIAQSQEVGIENLITKATADVIEEEVVNFVEKHAKTREDESQIFKGETESEINIVCSQDFLVDGQNLKLSIAEENEKVKINAIGYADTEEKASLMLATLISKFDEISTDGYSVLVNYGEFYAMYLTTDSGAILSGVNKDGTATMDMPDWIVSELTMTEDEANSYVNDILLALNEFGESNN